MAFNGWKFVIVDGNPKPGFYLARYVSLETRKTVLAIVNYDAEHGWIEQFRTHPEDETDFVELRRDVISYKKIEM